MRYYVFWRMKINPTSESGRILVPYPCAELDGPYLCEEDAKNALKRIEEKDTKKEIDKTTIICGDIIG